MNKHDEHIYLYAKNWYKITNVVDDMKVLLSHRSGVEKQHITRQDISSVLLGIAYKQLEKDGLTEAKFIDFIDGVNPSANWLRGGNRHDDFNICVINKCLSVLRFAEVDAKTMSNPDPNILPLREDIKSKSTCKRLKLQKNLKEI